MDREKEVLDTEQRFFGSLISCDREALDQLLTDDFTIVDILAGNVVPKGPFLEFVSSRAVTFYKIDRLETSVRFYDNTAVVVGRTKMEGSFQQQAFHANSRYTHVFVRQGDAWKLAAAQGTQIADPV